MEGPELILSDLFGYRRPPPGPLAENLSPVEHHDTCRLEPTAQHSSKVDEGESATLGRFLSPPRDDSVAPPVVREEGVDDVWQVCDLLPPVLPAPRKERRGHQKATLAELARMLAPVVARLILVQGGGALTTREIWAAVPYPKPDYGSLNSVGDALGHGRGQALHLRRGARGGILICQENTNVCMRLMTDTEVRSLADQLGYATREELLAAFGRLPLAETAPTA
jgi:hypothetical protein